jgi:hypothetical protein
VGEEISSRIIDLYLKQRIDPYPELIYFTYYNRLVLYFYSLTNRDTSVGSTLNSFRLSFSPAVKVVSIHYYESAYSHVDYKGLVQLWKYVDTNIVGNTPITTGYTKTPIYLNRNRKLVGKRKGMVMKHNVTHKTVSDIN